LYNILVTELLLVKYAARFVELDLILVS
jgi:hypothetical protein